MDSTKLFSDCHTLWHMPRMPPSPCHVHIHTHSNIEDNKINHVMKRVVCSPCLVLLLAFSLSSSSIPFFSILFDSYQEKMTHWYSFSEHHNVLGLWHFFGHLFSFFSSLRCWITVLTNGRCVTNFTLAMWAWPCSNLRGRSSDAIEHQP